MTVTVEHRTEVHNGKEYPLTITRQIGRQMVEFQGKMVEVEAVTIFDSPLGRSVCRTWVTPPVPPEERARNRRIVQEIATKAMIDQGIW